MTPAEVERADELRIEMASSTVDWTPEEIALVERADELRIEMASSTVDWTAEEIARVSAQQCALSQQLRADRRVLRRAHVVVPPGHSLEECHAAARSLVARSMRRIVMRSVATIAPRRTGARRRRARTAAARAAPSSDDGPPADPPHHLHHLDHRAVAEATS